MQGDACKEGNSRFLGLPPIFDVSCWWVYRCIWSMGLFRVAVFLGCTAPTEGLGPLPAPMRIYISGPPPPASQAQKKICCKCLMPKGLHAIGMRECYRLYAYIGNMYTQAHREALKHTSTCAYTTYSGECGFKALHVVVIYYMLYPIAT